MKFGENNNKRFPIQDIIILMKKLPSPHKSMILEDLILMNVILLSPDT